MERSANGRGANINQTARYPAGFVHLHLCQTGTENDIQQVQKHFQNVLEIEVQEDLLDMEECLKDVQFMACIPENLSGSIGELGRYSQNSRDKVSIDTSIFDTLDNFIINQTVQKRHNTKYCATRNGTEIIRRYKNKIICRGLVPLVSAVPANHTIPGREFFRWVCEYDLPLRKISFVLAIEHALIPLQYS